MAEIPKRYAVFLKEIRSRRLYGRGMAPQYKADLDLWRNRAEEARTQAEQMSNPETRRMMLQIAETYERMVAFEKGIEAAKKVMR